MHTYHIYGLAIESEVPCPHLPASHAEPDVRIHYGNVPCELEKAVDRGVLYQASSEQFLLQMDGVARYLVTSGREITVQPAPGVTDAEVAVFLLGPCLGALLHQRGVLALHASAIRTKAGAVLFCGRSGSGKSSLLAAMLARGYAMLNDDICAVVADGEGRATAVPAFPRTKLWADVATHLGNDLTALTRVRPELQKYHVPVAGQFASTRLPLSHIYVLRPRHEDGFEIAPVTPHMRFAEVVGQTYRWRFLDGMRMLGSHFHLASLAVQQAAVRVVHRPMMPLAVRELAEFVENDFDRDPGG